MKRVKQVMWDSFEIEAVLSVMVVVVEELSSFVHLLLSVFPCRSYFL